jgi:nitroreductase
MALKAAAALPLALAGAALAAPGAAPLAGEMDPLTAILTRRSVRAYTERPVAEDTLRAVLRAGMSAPSAGNEQPWVFVVIRDKAALARAGEINPYAAMAAKAPLAVLVCGDTTLDRYGGFWPLDCAACTQNMLLAAHALGLGAVWTGIWPLPERIDGFRTLAGLPSFIIPLALVVLGHPAERPGPEDRFKEDRIHQERWSGAPRESG